MTAQTVPTIHPGTVVPERHRCTTLDGPNGTAYWLYGFRGHDLTARFTLIHDGAACGDGTDVIFENVSWNTAWRAIVDRDLVPFRARHDSVDATLRSVLPEVTP